MSVAIARIAKSRSGKRYIVLKVRSTKRYAKVRIRLISKSGRTIKRMTVRIRANRTVKIRVSSRTRKARVALVR